MSKTLKDQKRREQVEAGAYDGRFRTKVVESKKRKQERKTKRVQLDRLDAIMTEEMEERFGTLNIEF